jgi:hypothetical protein
MPRTTWSRALLIVLALAFGALPASAALRPTQAKGQEPSGLLGVLWHAVVKLVPPLGKLGSRMDPLGNQGTTPPPATPNSGGDLGPGNGSPWARFFTGRAVDLLWGCQEAPLFAYTRVRSSYVLAYNQWT